MNDSDIAKKADRPVAYDLVDAVRKQELLSGEIAEAQKLRHECYSWSGDGSNERQRCLNSVGDMLGRYINLLMHEGRTK